MRTAVAMAAFAAGVLAVPYKRDVDVVTDVDVVYATDIVTVWATGVETTTAEPTTTTTEAAHFGHHWSHAWSYSSSSEESSTYVAPTTESTPTSTYVPPPPTTTSTSTTPTSTYVPPPPTSTTPTSTYVAPTPSSTYVAPTSTTAAATSAAAKPTGYSDTVVYHHNLHRANHSSPDIEWSDDLANSAQDIANSCVYAHNVEMDGGGYGQNIAAGVESNNISAIITNLFYNGEVGWFSGLYGEAQPDMTNFEHWGHFSQIVWAATTQVGCATQYCPNGLGNVGSDVAPYFTVCNYKAPGNYANEYGKNVGSSLNHPTANWDSGM